MSTTTPTPSTADTASTEPISIRSVGKTYDDGTRALNDVSIEIAPGEFVVLVGPSGCGKSTLLRAVAGLETITDGTIAVGDKVINNLPPQQRDLAMVFQNYALYPHMTVLDNIAFPLRMQRVGKDERRRRATEVAELLGLMPYAERRPGNLSGGQRQRVAMGRALVRRPVAFLMDEPLSNLDAKLRGEMRVEILELHRKSGVTTIYVTHDQTEAMTMADRIVAMEPLATGAKVNVAQIGTPNELYSHPESLFVAGFVGSPPMNFCSAPVEGSKVHLAGSTIDLDVVPSGKNVTVGFRAQDLHPEANPGDIEIPVRVHMTEFLGSVVEFRFAAPTLEFRHVGDQEDVAAIDAPYRGQILTADVGMVERVERLYIAPGRLHIFDNETGRRL